MDYRVVNIVVTLVILIAMAGVWLHSITSNKKEPRSLDRTEYPSTAWAFAFFAAVWFCTFSIYCSLALLKDLDPESVVVTVLRVFDNIAKVLLLGTAIAYSSGKEFNPKETLVGLSALFIVLTLWIFVCYGLGLLIPKNIFVTTMEVAPDVVISSIAIVAVGWVFFVRWGGASGWLFLLTTIGYAILQFPAAIKIGLSGYLKTDSTPQLDEAFSFLAGGKLLIAFGFILLIWHPKLPKLNVNKTKRWLPTGGVKMPKTMYQWLGWPISALASLATSALSEPLRSHLTAIFKSIMH